MKTRTLAFAALLVSSVAHAQPASTGAIEPPLSPRNASYVISARLDPSTRTIEGGEVLTWRNITNRTVTDLQFHLYWNAWRNAKSTWMREAALAGRSRTPRDDDWSRIDVKSVVMLAPEKTDLTPGRHFISPDDGNADDWTVMDVPLPKPAAPGAEIRLEINWTAHVPRTFARTGAIASFYFIAQWFPKIGVLQDSGWNCHQFHAGTEFFSDYGSYDVTLMVPTGWVVGATGVQRDRRADSDGYTTHRYAQDDVHDFAWTTSPDLVERTERFEHPPLPPVDMRLLLQPEHVSQADRHFAATRSSLLHYGEWYGPYPYGHITIVDPAYQSGAGGMEYPTLFTAGTRWLAPNGVTSPEGVTVHEAGHQFWYGIVGNNEFEDAWMDEGFNQFSTARTIAEDYSPNFLAPRYFGRFVPWVQRDIVLSRADDDGLDGYRRDATTDRESTPSYKYFPATGGSITYNKTALWLNTMEQWLGWPVLQRVMSTHFERWKFKHPKPDDYFQVVRDVTGQNLDWYFDEVYRGSGVFDYGVQELTSESDGSLYRTNVVVRRYGDATFPIDVLVTFKDGERATAAWDGRERWKLLTYVRGSQAVSAVVDPKRILLLDVNTTNNSKTLEPKGDQAATKWSVKWMVWLQDTLLSWAFFV